MNDLFSEFLLEAQGNVQSLNEAVDALLRDSSDVEAFKTVLRALHTLKGGFGVFEMKSVQNACHEIENFCGKDGSGKSEAFYFWLQSQAQALQQFLVQAREVGAPQDIPIAISPWSEGEMSLEDEFALAEKEVEKFFSKPAAPEAEMSDEVKDVVSTLEAVGMMGKPFSKF